MRRFASKSTSNGEIERERERERESSLPKLKVEDHVGRKILMPAEVSRDGSISNYSRCEMAAAAAACDELGIISYH